MYIKVKIYTCRQKSVSVEVFFLELVKKKELVRIKGFFAILVT